MLDRRSARVGHKALETFLRLCRPRIALVGAIVDGLEDLCMGSFPMGHIRTKNQQIVMSDEVTSTT